MIGLHRYHSIHTGRLIATQDLIDLVGTLFLLPVIPTYSS
jgi:hypothetical protein